MKRKLWQCLVNGHPTMIGMLAFLVAMEGAYWAATGRQLTGALLAHVPMLILNLYSWDYQRRHSKGSGQ